MTILSPARVALLPVLTLATLILAAPAARAQTVVFDNGRPIEVAVHSDADDQLFGSASFLAETFSFDSATRFDTVQWFGVYVLGNTPPATDAFTITFYGTTAGTPNINPFTTHRAGNVVNRTRTGRTLDVYEIFQYTSRLGRPLTLGPGTYGIGIVNNTRRDPDDNWFWNFSNSDGNYFFRNDRSEPYQKSSPERNLSFRLIDSGQVAAIPEPNELATGGIIAGTFLLGMVRARRKKA